MIVHKGFRFRVYPSAEQDDRLRRWQDALRFLWNLALEQWKMALARPRGERPYPNAIRQSRELTELRAELPWLKDVPRHACYQVLAELEDAWMRCFDRRTRAPRWKRRERDHFVVVETESGACGVRAGIIDFPKIGPMRAVVHRPLQGKPKRYIVRRDGDQWFVTVVCEVELPTPAPRHEPVVAIDRGIVNVVADSDGKVVPSPQFYHKSLTRLARAQRTVRRRQKGSVNREKAKARVMRIERTVRRQREHFIHCLSHDYAKSHGTVVVEKLLIANLTRNSDTREAIPVIDRATGITTTRTAAEWIALNGPGFLCSTEF